MFAEGGKQQGNAIDRGGVGGLGGGGIGNEGAAGNVSQQSPLNLAADADQCSMQTALLVRDETGRPILISALFSAVF